MWTGGGLSEPNRTVPVMAVMSLYNISGTALLAKLPIKLRRAVAHRAEQRNGDLGAAASNMRNHLLNVLTDTRLAHGYEILATRADCSQDHDHIASFAEAPHGVRTLWERVIRASSGYAPLSRVMQNGRRVQQDGAAATFWRPKRILVGSHECQKGRQRQLRMETATSTKK